MNVPDDPVAAFHRLHSSGCFVMPNPWDVGSARALEQLGFPALATTSAGFAWTLGRADERGHARSGASGTSESIVDAVSVPVNADFQGGFARDPARRRSERAGWPRRPGSPGSRSRTPQATQADPLFEFELAVERVAAARQAIDESGTGVVLTGRSEGFVCRPARHRRDHPAAQRLRRGRRRLPLRAAHRQARARLGDRRRRRPQTGEPADQRSVHRRSRKRPSWAYGASAWAARLRARPGVASCRPRRRSPTTGRSAVRRTAERRRALRLKRTQPDLPTAPAMSDGAVPAMTANQFGTRLEMIAA